MMYDPRMATQETRDDDLWVFRSLTFVLHGYVLLPGNVGIGHGPLVSSALEA